MGPVEPTITTGPVEPVELVRGEEDVQPVLSVELGQVGGIPQSNISTCRVTSKPLTQAGVTQTSIDLPARLVNMTGSNLPPRLVTRPTRSGVAEL